VTYFNEIFTKMLSHFMNFKFACTRRNVRVFQLHTCRHGKYVCWKPITYLIYFLHNKTLAQFFSLVQELLSQATIHRKRKIYYENVAFFCDFNIYFISFCNTHYWKWYLHNCTYKIIYETFKLIIYGLLLFYQLLYNTMLL